MSDQRVLGVSELGASYGGNQIVRRANLDVHRRQVVLLVGRNGAGKSTLLKAMVGLIRPDQGQVILSGVDVAGRPPDEISRAGLGYVPQERAVFTGLTVRDNLRLGAYQLSRAIGRERMDEVLQLFVPLQARQHQKAGSLSGGERRMLAVAIALIRQPAAVALDEPSAGLSPAATQVVFELIRRLRDELQLAVLLVEQNVQEALDFSDEVVVMRHGETSPARPASAIREAGAISDVL